VLTNGRKINHILLAAVFLFGPGFFFKLAINPIGREFAVVVGIVFLAPEAMFLVQAWRSRLILEPDAIEITSVIPHPPALQPSYLCK